MDWGDKGDLEEDNTGCDVEDEVTIVACSVVEDGLEVVVNTSPAEVE